MRIIYLYTLLTLFPSVYFVSAQDPHFSQFYSNPVYLNPAFVGTADGNRVVLNHRRQWSKPICFISSALSVDGKFNSIKSGWGLQIVQDHQANGTLKQTFVNSSFAHRIQLSKNQYLGMGLKIGIYDKKFDWSNLTFEDQIDERNGVINPTNERFGKDKIVNGDVSVGVLYIAKNLFGGITANHVNRPREDFAITTENRLSIKYTAHLGAIIHLNVPGQKQFFSPNIIFEKQGPSSYTNLGMYYGTETFSVGGYYRINDALIGLLGANYRHFKFGYSYDVTVSKIATGRNNSHEISIAYLFELPKSYNKKGRYKGKCPKFYKYLL